MRSGSTVSLVERQVEVLREQKTDADRRLAEFVVGRARQRAARRQASTASRAACCARPHRWRRSPRSRRRCAKTSMRFTRCCCSSTPDRSPRAGQLRAVPADRAAPRTRTTRSFEALLATGKPRCGQVRDSQRDFLFGPEAASIGSVALVPLGDNGFAGPAGARQRRTRAFSSRHEHGIPRAHGRLTRMRCRGQ